MEIEDPTVIEAASWRLASALVRRHPEARIVRHHPGGGQYDCLAVCAPDEAGGQIDLNRNGSIHISHRFDGRDVDAFDPIGWAEYLAAQHHGFVERLERAAGLVPPSEVPSFVPSSLTAAVLAVIAALSFKAEPVIDIQPGQLDSSGPGGSGPNPLLERFPVPDDLLERRTDDRFGAPGYRFWIVVRGDEPVLAIEQEQGLSWTDGGGDVIDLVRAFDAAGGDVAVVALELLAAARRSATRTLPFGALEWDDPALVVVSDPPLRRRYRALQSHYRQHVLAAPSGVGGNGRPVGSVLADDAVASDPGLNFFGDPQIVEYVDRRVPQVLGDGGSLDEQRLRHNMLSSMPMAFSLAAKLRATPGAVEILRRTFDLDIAFVDSVDAEWAPMPATTFLGDRSAFDVVVRYRTSSDEQAVLGIETKYTEPLSIKEYTKDRYVEVTAASGWFTADAGAHLVDKKTNQLWRNAMLAASMVIGDEVAVAHLGVVGLEVDSGLWSSVDALQQHMIDPDRVRSCSWEALVGAFAGTSLEAFGKLFRQRYLDTSVVEG